MPAAMHVKDMLSPTLAVEFIGMRSISILPEIIIQNFSNKNFNSVMLSKMNWMLIYSGRNYRQIIV